MVIPIVLDYERSNEPVISELTSKRVSRTPLMRPGPPTPTITLAADLDENSVATTTTQLTAIVP